MPFTTSVESCLILLSDRARQASFVRTTSSEVVTFFFAHTVTSGTSGLLYLFAGLRSDFVKRSTLTLSSPARFRESVPAIFPTSTDLKTVVSTTTFTIESLGSVFGTDNPGVAISEVMEASVFNPETTIAGPEGVNSLFTVFSILLSSARPGPRWPGWGICPRPKQPRPDVSSDSVTGSAPPTL